jgi:hypothetical protein
VGALVGRQRELGELDGALAAVESGRGTLLLIRGEPGIGKTQLATELATRATSRGARVAWGRAWEAGGAPAYWPWIEIFRSLLQQASTDERAAMPASRLAELAQIDSELAACTPGAASPPQLEPKQARFRLFDAAAAVLVAASARTPVIAVLDDLHAADAATIEMLHFVARSVRTARVLIAATYRDSEARARADIADAIARLCRDGQVLQLRRLAETDVTEWLAGAGRSDLGHLVYERSEGNPLFVVELLRLVDELGARALAEIPDGVRDVIGQRLRGLPEHVRELLHAACVVGRTVDLRIIGTLLDTSVDGLLADLSVALATRVIVPGASRHVVTFSHVLIQEVLYSELPVDKRAAMHGSIADVLLAAAADPAEVAHHLFAAIPARGSSAAIEAARLAAREAGQRLAFDDAVAMLDRALREVGSSAHALRIDVLLELASALFAAGQPAAGRERALEALTLSRQSADAERLARAALLVGTAPRFAMVDPDLVMWLQEALAALPDGDSNLRARVLARLGGAQQPAPDPEPPMLLARQAIAMSHRVADPATHLEVLHSATSALGYFADPGERAVHNQELAVLASRLGDKPRALRGHLRLVFDYLEAGDTVQADACIEVCARLANQLGRPTYQWAIPLMRAMRRVMQGQFAEAEALAEEARAIATRAEDTNLETAFTFHRIGFLRASARHDELAAMIVAAIPVITRVSDHLFAQPCIAGVHARIGARQDARTIVDELSPSLHQMRGRLSGVWLVEAAALLDDAALAERMLPLLEPLASRNHVGAVMAMWAEGPVTRALGLAAATAKFFDVAEMHFETALTRAAALGAPPHRARIELEYASMLMKRGRPADHDRAARLLDAARETAVRLRMPGLIDERSPAKLIAPRAALPAFELRPEGDFWTVTSGTRVFRLKDSRGLRILALLVASPEREFHVLDLAAPSGGESAPTEDAGDALDARAVAAYKQRISDLREELAEAEGWADQGRAGKLRDELDAVASELAHGLGLGGRARKASSNVERARVNVRKRVLDAITRIGEHDTDLSHHLEVAVKTGAFCSYNPSGRARAR